jgi:hypothetical protein
VVLLPFYLVHVENRVCMSHGVQVTSVAWWALMMIVVGVGDLGYRNGDSRTGQVLDGRTIGRSGVRSAPCTRRQKV